MIIGTYSYSLLRSFPAPDVKCSVTACPKFSSTRGELQLYGLHRAHVRPTFSGVESCLQSHTESNISTLP